MAPPAGTRSPASAASESGTNMAAVELRAWLQADVTRIKEDIDVIFERLKEVTKQADLAHAKAYEVAALMEKFQERMSELSITVGRLKQDNDNGVDEVDFIEYKRAVDKDLQAVKDILTTNINGVKDSLTITIEAKLKPITDSIAVDRKELLDMREKLNALMIKWSIAVAAIAFVAAKGIDVVLKFLGK